MKKFKLDSLIIVVMYMAITHCFYLLPDSLFVFPVGKLYDVILLISLLLVCKKKNWRIIISNSNIKAISLIYLSWLLYCGFEFMRALQIQGFGSVIRGVRENFLFLIFFLILNLKDFDSKKILRVIVYCEIIGATIYILQFLIGKPILYAEYTYQQVGGMSFLRSYANLPLMNVFITSLLTIGIIEKKYIFSKEKDIIFLLLLTISIFLHFQRSYYMAFALSLILCVLVSKMRFSLMKKISMIVLILFTIFAILPSLFPNVFKYISTALSEYKDGGGNGLLRVNAFLSRYNYLISNKKSMFGLGTVSADYIISGLDSYVSTVRIIDMAYGTILIRYGVFGLIYYCGFWMISGIKSLASKTTIGKSVFVFIISSMFLSLTGEVIIDYGILIFGILLGIWAIDLKNNGLQQD